MRLGPTQVTPCVRHPFQQRVVLLQINHRYRDPRRHRPRRLLAQQRADRQLAEGLLLVQQLGQRRCDLGLTLSGRQVEDADVLAVRPPRLLGHQGVVGPPIGHRRIQVLAVHIAGERPRLTHQPGTDVPVVDAVVVLSPQPLHLLHALSRIPHLDRLGSAAGLHDFPDQSRGHRVAVLLHADGAAPAHPDPLPFQRVQPAGRQRPQVWYFRRERLLAGGIPPRHQRPHELRIRLPAGEIPAAPQQQDLVHGLFATPVGLLAIAVLVATGGVGRLGLQAVMPQQGLVLRRVLFGMAIVMHRQGHAVGAMPLRHAAQFPQGVLQPLAQAGEALRKAQRHVFPVRVREHKVIDQMRERLPLNRHPQLFHVAEIRGAQAPRFMHLGEEHFLGRPVLGLPLPHPPLQRAPRGLPVTVGILLLEPLQQRLGLQARLALE